MKTKLLLRLIAKKIRFGKNYFFNQGKLPDFIIAGVQKGGTTFLNANLSLHSQVEMNPNFFHRNPIGKISFKEPNFFGDTSRYGKGLRWYKSLFNVNKRTQGEATPNYINDERTIKRIYEAAPNVKLVVILRDPVSRAYSNFNHFTSIPSLHQYLLKPDGDFEENILEEIRQKFPPKKIISQGFYDDMLANIYKYFSKDQVLILISEHAKKNPIIALNSICDFLNIKEFDGKLKSSVHVRDYPEPIAPEAETMLYDLFRPHNKRLFERLGFEIEEWKR